MVKFLSSINQDAAKDVGNNVIKKAMKNIIPLCAVMIVLGIIMLLLGELFYLGLFCIIFGIVLIPIFIIGQKRSISKSKVIDLGITEEYLFYEDHFEIKQYNEDGYESSANFPFSFVKNVEKSKGNYFVTTSFNQVHLVKINDLVEGSLEELDAIFTNALGTMFVKK